MDIFHLTGDRSGFAFPEVATSRNPGRCAMTSVYSGSGELSFLSNTFHLSGDTWQLSATLFQLAELLAELLRLRKKFDSEEKSVEIWYISW
jgi:hypothetical protein